MDLVHTEQIHYRQRKNIVNCIAYLPIYTSVTELQQRLVLRLVLDSGELCR